MTKDVPLTEILMIAFRGKILAEKAKDKWDKLQMHAPLTVVVQEA